MSWGLTPRRTNARGTEIERMFRVTQKRQSIGRQLLRSTCRPKENVGIQNEIQALSPKHFCNFPLSHAVKIVGDLDLTFHETQPSFRT